MRVIRNLRGLRVWRRAVCSSRVVGLVPTMGALHDGHVSLFRRARTVCGLVVVCIFVNPLQFAPTEDLGRYPRMLQDDRRVCLASGVDLIFCPQAADLYPDSFQTSVAVNGLTQRWEGKVRPTHFLGVTTVLTKLFNLVCPRRAYFGQKDYQQYVVTKQLAEDLNLPVSIVRCPIIREADGLAMSSRNRYLEATDREVASTLYHALSAGARAIKGGEQSGKKIQHVMARICQQCPSLSVEYLAVCHPQTLEPLQRIDQGAVLLGAVRIGSVRLIDNILVAAGAP